MPRFYCNRLKQKKQRKKEVAEKMSVIPSQTALADLLNFMVYMSSDKFNSVSGRVFNIDSRIVLL